MGPPGCGKSYYAKKYQFLKILDFQKNIIYLIFTLNKLLNKLNLNKLKMDS